MSDIALFPDPLFIAHTLNKGEEPTATLASQLKRGDRAALFAEIRDVLRHCTIAGITWLLSQPECARIIRETTDSSTVTTLMISVLSRPDSCVVLALLCHTHHCRQFSLQSPTYQKSRARDLLVTQLLDADNAHVLMINLLAALQCRAPMAAIECRPCRSGERRWNLLKHVVGCMKDSGGCLSREKTSTWIKSAAACFSFGASPITIDSTCLAFVISLALSAPDDVVVEARLILDKCASMRTLCVGDCVLSQASRICIPRKSTAALFRRFVTTVNVHTAGYEDHIAIGKCPRYLFPLHFFSARKYAYDIEPQDAQELLELDFRGSYLGEDIALNDRTYRLVRFLVRASKHFKVQLPNIGAANFQILAVMVMCGIMNDITERRKLYWMHDVFWATIGTLNRFIIHINSDETESVAQFFAERYTACFPPMGVAAYDMLENNDCFADNPFILLMWTQIRNAISTVLESRTVVTDSLIAIGAQLDIPNNVVLMKNLALASKILVANSTRNRLIAFLCSAQKAHELKKIRANHDVVSMIASMYISALLTN